VWSGQGSDPEDWYSSWSFWRLGSIPALFALYGGVGAMTRSVTVPGTSIDLNGWSAVFAGIGILVLGGLALGLLVALWNRMS